MKAKEIIKEIQRLPLTKQMLVAELILKSIRERELKEKMEKAADELLDDYLTDNELTIFTNIDFEDFYETR